MRRFKLSVTSLIFLVIGIAGILVLSLNVAQVSQRQEQAQLNEEIEIARMRLDKFPPQELSSQKSEMESQIAEAEAQLKIDKASLYQLTQSIEATEVVFEIAEENLVEVTSVGSSGVVSDTLEGVDLSMTSITVVVEGEVLDIVGFIYDWTHAYSTGMVQSVAITVPEVTVGEDGEEIEGVPSAAVSMSIYSYVGD